MFIVKLIVALVTKQSSMEGSYGVMMATSLVCSPIFVIDLFSETSLQGVAVCLQPASTIAHQEKVERVAWFGSEHDAIPLHLPLQLRRLQQGSSLPCSSKLGLPA